MIPECIQIWCWIISNLPFWLERLLRVTALLTAPPAAFPEPPCFSMPWFLRCLKRGGKNNGGFSDKAEFFERKPCRQENSTVRSTKYLLEEKTHHFVTMTHDFTFQKTWNFSWTRWLEICRCFFSLAIGILHTNYIPFQQTWKWKMIIFFKRKLIFFKGSLSVHFGCLFQGMKSWLFPKKRGWHDEILNPPPKKDFFEIATFCQFFSGDKTVLKEDEGFRRNGRCERSLLISRIHPGNSKNSNQTIFGVWNPGNLTKSNHSNLGHPIFGA